MGSVSGEGTALNLCYGDDYTTVYICQMSQSYSPKRVNFAACKLSENKDILYQNLLVLAKLLRGKFIALKLMF